MNIPAVLSVVMLACCTALTAPVLAQGYPDRPIRLVIPYPPGGGTDILMRYLMNRVEANENWRIVIDNRAGATGVIGAREVSRAKPDGYTLLAGHIAPNAINPGEFADPKFAPDWPLTEVALAAEAPSLLLAQNELPFSDLAGMKTWLRSQKSPAYGSDGAGSLAHLQMELLMNMPGLTHVPYKGGGPALQGFMSKDVPVLFSPAPVAIPHIASGRFRVIAQTGATRLATLPNIPTMIESGEKEFSAPLWWGVFAPVGTPEDIVRRWNAAVNRALAEPSVLKWLADQGYAARPLTPKEFSAYVQRETERWSRVIANIRN